MNKKKSTIKTLIIIDRLGRCARYAGVVAFFALILAGKYKLAGVIGFFTFVISYIFRTDETGDTSSERRSFFEKIFDLKPYDKN